MCVCLCELLLAKRIFCKCHTLPYPIGVPNCPLRPPQIYRYMYWSIFKLWLQPHSAPLEKQKQPCHTVDLTPPLWGHFLYSISMHCTNCTSTFIYSTSIHMNWSIFKLTAANLLTYCTLHLHLCTLCVLCDDLIYTCTDIYSKGDCKKKAAMASYCRFDRISLNCKLVFQCL